MIELILIEGAVELFYQFSEEHEDNLLLNRVLLEADRYQFGDFEDILLITDIHYAILDQTKQFFWGCILHEESIERKYSLNGQFQSILGFELRYFFEDVHIEKVDLQLTERFSNLAYEFEGCFHIPFRFVVDLLHYFFE